jgi:hypothetical protein
VELHAPREWNNLLEQENEILTGLPGPTIGCWVPRWTGCDLTLHAGGLVQRF